MNDEKQLVGIAIEWDENKFSETGLSMGEKAARVIRETESEIQKALLKELLKVERKEIGTKDVCLKYSEIGLYPIEISLSCGCSCIVISENYWRTEQCEHGHYLIRLKEKKWRIR